MIFLSIELKISAFWKSWNQFHPYDFWRKIITWPSLTENGAMFSYYQKKALLYFCGFQFLIYIFIFFFFRNSAFAGVQLEYDRFSRLSVWRWGALTEKYGYDRAGRLSEIRYADDTSTLYAFKDMFSSLVSHNCVLSSLVNPVRKIRNAYTIQTQPLQWFQILLSTFVF